VKRSLMFRRKGTMWWMLASIAWIALILWRAVGEAPTLPLDVNGKSPDVKAAFNTAVTHHYLRTGLLALGVPLVAYGLGCLLCRLRGSSPTITATDHPDGGPSRILLKRHAEKTGDPEDIHLSAEGVKRAAQLATYIPQTFGKPDFIFAAAQSKRSVRSIETVEPLAAAVGKTVQHDIEDKDFEQLVSEIFSNPDFRGKTIVVCWHHKKLPEIAALLGAPPGSYPSAWSEDVFNLILDFRYDPNSDAPPTVTQVVEPF
jgi:hypothetical protein